MQKLTRQLNILYPSLPENNFFFTFNRSVLSLTTYKTKNALIIRNCGDKLVWHYFDRYDEERSHPHEKNLRSISVIEFKDKIEVIFDHDINVATSFYFGVKSLLIDRLEALMCDALQIDVQLIRKLYTSKKLPLFYKKIDESIDIIKSTNHIDGNEFDALDSPDLYFLQSIKALLQANSKLLSLDSSPLSVNPSYYEEMDIVDENNEFKRLFNEFSRVKIFYNSLSNYLADQGIETKNFSNAKGTLLNQLNNNKSRLFNCLIEEVARDTLFHNLNTYIPVVKNNRMTVENAGILIGCQYIIDDNTLLRSKKSDGKLALLEIHNLRFNFDLDNINIILEREPECRYVFRDKVTGTILPNTFYFLDEEKYKSFYKKMAQLVKDTQIYTLKQMHLQISYQQLFEKVKAEMDDFMNNVQVVNDQIDDYLDKNINIEVV